MKVFTASLAAVLAGGPLLASAFAGTYPILAWSSHPLAALDQLSPSSATTHSAFRPTSQTPFPPSQPSDLCSLRSILLVSVPGLHHSDFALLPESTAGIRASLQQLDRESQVLSVPYVDGRRTYVNPAERLAKTFVGECGAVMGSEGLANFWAGEEGREIRIEAVDGLQDWKLLGKSVKDKRRRVVEKIDELVESHLNTLQAPYLVILTTLSPSSTAAIVPAKAASLRKRQLASSSAKEFEGVDTLRIIAAVAPGDDDDEDEPTPTSIFAVDPNSGLLHRYVFFTPSLIVCLLVTLLLLLPVLIVTSTALTTTNTLAGLEGKMTGTVGVDPSKS